MDVLTILSTLLRRWKILAAVLALTGVALAAIVLRTDPTYEIRGSFLVTSPALGGGGGGVALHGDDGTGSRSGLGALNTAVVAEAVQSGAVVEEVVKGGGSARYQVEAEGELLRVAATSSDRAAVVRTVDNVLSAIEREVATVQEEAGVPADRRAAVERIAVPNNASVQGRRDQAGNVIYSAAGSARIIGSGTVGVGTETANPYANHHFTYRILEEILNSEPAQEHMIEAGATGGFAIEMEERDTAPIVYFSGRGTTPDEAAETFEAVTQLASGELSARQTVLGAPGAARVDLFPLSVPDGARKLSSGLARPLITVAGLGGMAAVGSALLVDNLLPAWRKRREADDTASEEVAADDEGMTGAAPATFGRSLREALQTLRIPRSRKQDEEVTVPEADVTSAEEAEAAVGREHDSQPDSGRQPEPVVVAGHDGTDTPDTGPETATAPPGTACGNGKSTAYRTSETAYLAVMEKVFGSTARPAHVAGELLETCAAERR